MAEKLKTGRSDVVRYAIRIVLTRLNALHDPQAWGAELLPAMIDYCIELNRHFDLDADRLDAILNGNADGKSDRIIARQDIELLALCGMPVEMIQARFQEVTGIELRHEEVYHFMKAYLIDKYITK